MTDYPVLLKLSGRLCIVVGGGAVGLRKVRGLLEAGARVRLITDRLLPDQKVPTETEIILRPFQPGDLREAFLAVAATGDRATDRAIADEARQLGKPVNVPGDPDLGDFNLPAVLRRGDLTVAVSTGGQSPALAAQLIGRLAKQFGPCWETVVRIAAAIRRKSLAFPDKIPYNQHVISSLLDAGLPELIANGDAESIRGLLQQVLGTDFNLTDFDIEGPAEIT